MNLLKWILVLLLVAVLASALGATFVGHALANIAWILFVVMLILVVISFVTGSRRPV